MASFPQCCCCCFLLLIISGLFFLIASPAEAGSPIGINYGQIGNNLPTPDRVAGLLQEIGVNKVKLYDSDNRVLSAFSGSAVDFVIAIPNENVAKMTDPAKAAAWVKSNVQAYAPNTKIRLVTVGNEALTANDSVLASSLVPAMENVHAALQAAGLQIAVTTAHSLAVLGTSYPPSAGQFRRDIVGCMKGLLNFLAETGSPLMINAYPFFAYMADPKHISLDYVLFKPNSGVVDGNSGLRYDNMLFAQIDAVYSAVAAMGHQNLTVKVSETGWPSCGDSNEVGASPENAAEYNGNLMKLVAEKKGTPVRPDVGVEVYVFALFNENMKPGPTSERNYGLFKPNGVPVYNVGLNRVKTAHAAAPPGNQSAIGGGFDGGSSTGSTATFATFSSAIGHGLDLWWIIMLQGLCSLFVLGYN